MGGSQDTQSLSQQGFKFGLNSSATDDSIQTDKNILSVQVTLL